MLCWAKRSLHSNEGWRDPPHSLLTQQLLPWQPPGNRKELWKSHCVMHDAPPQLTEPLGISWFLCHKVTRAHFEVFLFLIDFSPYFCGSVISEQMRLWPTSNDISRQRDDMSTGSMSGTQYGVFCRGWQLRFCSVLCYCFGSTPCLHYKTDSNLVIIRLLSLTTHDTNCFLRQRIYISPSSSRPGIIGGGPILGHRPPVLLDSQEKMI